MKDNQYICVASDKDNHRKSKTLDVFAINK